MVSELHSVIREIFASFGISQCGFCAYDAVLPLLPVRSASRIPENAKTVIFALFPYNIGEYPDRNISRYAIPDDYHIIAGELLKNCAEALKNKFPNDEFIPFVDSSPIREVHGAYLAGLGYLGKNGLLIHPTFGSYVFIGELVTTLELSPDREPMGECLNCGKCLSACPSGALCEGMVNEERCRSAITQKKGELTEWEQQQLISGGLVWGCDICNDVCPMNKNAALSDLQPFYENATAVITYENLPLLRKQKAFNYRSRSVMERNLALLERDEN